MDVTDFGMGSLEMGGFGGGMFTLVPILIAVVFLVLIGFIAVGIVQGAKQWNKNNHSPVLTVDATVVTKRGDTQYHHHTGGGMDDMHHHTTTSSTTYYTTFEVASGDRMEFQVADREYGMLVEGDKGKLTFQGTRYLGFERGEEVD